MSIKQKTGDITRQVVQQRNERQVNNNKLAYDSIKQNPNITDNKNINKKALDRLLNHLDYDNLGNVIKDKNNYEEIIIKLASLYIAKNASRQGSIDEDLQLQSINTLQEYYIEIIKDGRQKPVKDGGIRKSGKKQTDELKSIDFVIKYNKEEIGYIMAKVTLGKGGHQDNVLDEITQFCDWSIQHKKKSKLKKAYVVLYDSMNTSTLFTDIKKLYKNSNLILTNTKKFKNDFLNWFNNI